MPGSQDCLPSTGADPSGFAIVAVLAVLLLAAGLVTVVVAQRNRSLASAHTRSGTHPSRRHRNSTGTALALALAILVAAGSGLVAAPAPASAAVDCSSIKGDSDVTFASGGITIHGSYRGPLGSSQPVAAAVIVGGTGDVDRNGNGAGIAMQEYEWLADLLAEQGIASLRYDKVGTGATGLGPYADDPDALLSRSYDELRIQPVRDALSFVAAQPGIDASRLILIGHSEGGAVSISVANDPGSAPAIAGLALIEPSYDRILSVVPSQLAQQIDGAVAGGAMTAADGDTLKAWMADGVEEIRSGTPPYPTPGPVPLPGATDYTAVMQTTIANNIYGSDPAQMVISHAYRTLYGKQFDEIAPPAIAPSITIPVLITCGTKDFNTPCGDGTAGSGVVALANAFAPGVARFVELPNMVHIMRDVGTADVPALADQVKYPFSALLETEFTAFVSQFSD
ncbi:alpha/beta hydrolase [Leucobacter rhizosphaerae]|uniref:Alpha/beta hydrolase n=1 Tax=Leucobacter rhizosphaerae TaxID=2932245 RepID=A0ABY4FYX0_9MICO|nr:alpha/beta hydrolase [Leucobacter rhizosphaerae]UOQ61482.1 alpha/beta hydrolase [Leucobacter rhizosphaerae]